MIRDACAGFNCNKPILPLMFRITKADVKWSIKVLSFSILSSVLALILSVTYPDYRMPIIYTNSGFIICLILLTARKIEWNK